MFKFLNSKTFFISLKASWPICAGYFPLGFACGVLAQKAGLTPAEIGLLSIIVFAGSAQFIAVSMLLNGAGLLSIIATTLIVNLRHMLMSSSLSVFLSGANKKFLLLFGYGITDETFAINLNQFENARWNKYQALSVNHIANFVWVFSNVCGGVIGLKISTDLFGISYSLTAMFIGLIALNLKNKIYIITGIASGLIAVVLSLYFKNHLYIIIASVTAATLGYFLKQKINKKTAA
ncbi:MAG: AzlC family ABC transporter permease [Deltaproteobacteria bacterium]|nr:AzlC family ABC transporter permease [Deltaproteobacteria bacterium]